MSTSRTSQVFTLHQATQNSPTLARLSQLAQESNKRLLAVKSLIPAALHPVIKAGPIDNETWCLLVSNSAAAAKLRQLLPTMQSHLKFKGWGVNAIRLKIQA